MRIEKRNKDEIFNAAAELADAGERAAFLDQACGEDANLKLEIVDLLKHDLERDSLLDRSAAGLSSTGLSPTVMWPLTERPGEMVGRYKLLQQIGEGGMGVVWMAEQQQPVRRRVALKVIKPGMDSKAVLARFEAERQALAMMDHQNIAKVLDAGATESGRPFFVMELVHGVPITTFCEKNRCSVRDRLELFIPVCQAIQHAHQKGIIHRDIKPTNVLVTIYDDKPVPKVIDFGIAKAVDQRLTERTLFTQYGTIVGTLEYMPPEQAELNALGVDTRSDVYSLGALLYELLTGTPPLDRSLVRDLAWKEVLKKIQEEDPLRPSLRLSSSESLAQFAEICHTTPTALPRMLSRELDWIVMKCLEKNRTRRYETANGLARDLERYLADEPVEACPPTFYYRLQKATRRHRLALSITAAFVTLLIVGVVVSATFASWALKSRHEALQAQAKTAESLARETAARLEAQMARQEAESLVVRLRQATRLANEGREYYERGMWSDAHRNYSKAIETEPNYRDAFISRGELYARFGQWEHMAADFDTRFQLADRGNPVTLINHALLRAYVSDEAGHRRVCLIFLDRLKGSPHVVHHQLVVRAMAVSPTPLIEKSRLVELAENALQRKYNSYGLYVAGLAHLRAGELEMAVRQFRDALSQATTSPIPIHRAGYAPLAIALHHLGKHDDAKEALEHAHLILQEVIPTVINADDSKPRKIMTHEWLEFWLLLREAEQLIRQQPLELDPVLVEWRDRSWEMLNAAPNQQDPMLQEEANFEEPQTRATTPITGLAGASTEFTESDDPPNRMWNDAAMQTLELPLANADATPRHVPADYYYRFPEWEIYQTYPVYHPEHEPPNYFGELASTEPVILWGATQRPELGTEEEWRAAGELVFDWPIAFGSGRMLPSTETSLIVRDAKWYRDHDVPVTSEGINPFYRYVIRERGKVEVGVLSCAMCHTRILPDGKFVKGAQGNLPFSRIYGSQMREAGAIPNAVRGLERNLFGAPWLVPDPQQQLWTTPLAELSEAHSTIPPGVLARHRSSPVSPVVVPDLFGLKNRRYLDRTGLQRHRGIEDLMRYAALNQGMDNLSRFGNFVPAGSDFKDLPEPESYLFRRYSDKQLLALARYAYSLETPTNPHKFDEPAQRGQQVFRAQGCARCHDPEKDYGNDLLVAAPGFEVPDDHPDKERIIRTQVNTDPILTMATRRGTGLYKIPSLRGAWLRGPFEHNGSVATLEDWFNPRRLDDDYVPTGWKGPPGTTTRAVKGHPFGLNLSDEDRSALIAFLRSL
jgi:serine/threonine protein kinase